MSLIEITHVDKIYNTSAVPVHAVRNISLEIAKKEFTAIVGPSGSGKTTLLNMIGGLDQPTEGNIVIEAVDISTMTSGKLVEYRLQNICEESQGRNLLCDRETL